MKKKYDRENEMKYLKIEAERIEKSKNPKICLLSKEDKIIMSNILAPHTQKKEVKLSHFPNNPVLESEPPFQCPISFESYLNNPPSSREGKKVWSRYQKKAKRKKMKEIYMLLGKQRKPPDK